MAFLPRIFAAVLTVAALASCITDKPYQQPDTNPPVQSGLIVGCGGQVSRSVTAKLEAEYSKILTSGGKADLTFENSLKGILVNEGLTGPKYDSYLACFLKQVTLNIAQNERKQCLSSCGTDRGYCTANVTKKYDSCIQGGVAACLSECARTTDKDLNTCKTMCSTAKPYNIGNWEKRHGCSQETSSCDAAATSCRAACPAIKLD